MLKRSLIIITAMLLLGGQSYAGDAGRESVFSVGVGARAIGMGGAFTALSHDGSAIYYNAAGLSRLNSQELTFMYLNLFEGSEFHFGSWVNPIGDNFGFGIGYMRVGTNGITRTQNFVPLGEFSYSHSQFLFGLGYNNADRVSIGATFKVVNQELDDRSDYSAAADAGLLIILPKHLRIGLAARDFIPTNFKLDDDNEKFPTSIAGGIGIDSAPISDKTKISASVEVEKAENRDEKIHTGGEVLVDDKYAVRAGYDRDNWAVGVGYSISALSIDYAYKILENVDNSHFFSLSYRMGKTRDRTEQEESIEPSSKTTIEQEYDRQFTFYKTKADDYFDRAQFDSARVYYYKAMAFDPDNKDIKNSIEFIDKTKLENERVQNSMTESADDIVDRRLNFLYLNQSKNFYEKKFYVPALDIVNQLLERSPKNEEAKQLKSKIEKNLNKAVDDRMKEAKSAERNDELAKAVEAYTRVLELDPSQSDARVKRDQLIRQIGISEKLYLGISQFQQQKFAQAKTQFETVLKYDPENKVAKDFLAQINKLAAQPTTLEELQADTDIWPLYLEGLRFMREKQYQKAIDTWHKVLAAYPNSTHTLNNIQQARLRLEAEK